MSRYHEPGRTAIRVECIRDKSVPVRARGFLLSALAPRGCSEGLRGLLHELEVGAYEWATLRETLMKAGYLRAVSGGYEFTDNPENPSEFFRRYSANVRAKRDIPDALRWEIWERDDFRCQDCGTRRFLSVDHIIPESHGGTIDRENLRTLCKSCNSRRGGKMFGGGRA